MVMTFLITEQEDGGYETMHFFNPDGIAHISSKTLEEMEETLCDIMGEYFPKQDRFFEMSFRVDRKNWGGYNGV